VSGEVPGLAFKNSQTLVNDEGIWKRIRCPANHETPAILEEFFPARLIEGYKFGYRRCDGVSRQNLLVLSIGTTFSASGEDYSGFVIRTFEIDTLTDAFYDFSIGPIVFEQRRLTWNGVSWVLDPDAPVETRFVLEE